MTRQNFDELSLDRYKQLAKYIGMHQSMQKCTTRASISEKILAYIEENSLPLDTIPDDFENPTEVKLEEPKPIKAGKTPIASFPKKRVIVECRDSEVSDYPFSVNEYTCYIQMGKEVLLPTPVIEHIKAITTVKFTKDEKTGFAKHEEINKFFVTVL